jgi:hypothetical protein
MIALILRGLVMRSGKCIALLWVQSNLTEVSTLQTRNESTQRHCTANEAEEWKNGGPKLGNESLGGTEITGKYDD